MASFWLILAAIFRQVSCAAFIPTAMTFSPSSATTGTTATSLSIAFDPGAAHANGNSIWFEVGGLSAALFGTVSAAFDQNGVDGTNSGTDFVKDANSFLTLAHSSTSQTFAVIVGTGALASGTSYTLVLKTGVLLPFGTTGNQITIRGYGDTSATTAAPTFTGSVLNGPLVAAVSDPMTFYNGTKVKFWFPVGQPQILIATPDIIVYATTFQGPSVDLQWFREFIVTLPDGQEVVRVRVKQNPPGANRSSYRPGYFNQIEAELGGRPIRRLESQLYHANDGLVHVGIGTRLDKKPRVHGSLITEYVHVETATIEFVLLPNHAGNEFRDNVELQKKYAHMDFIIMEMRDHIMEFTGLLPEIWRFSQPMSELTKQFLIPPSEAFLAIGGCASTEQSICASSKY